MSEPQSPPSSPEATEADAPPEADGAPPTLADRLRDVRVGLRPELEFSRHVFRGEVNYVARDPITFQSHRMDQDEYDVLIEIDENATLDENFDLMVERGKLDADDSEHYYEFVVSLHQLGFLNLPVGDGDRLYRRFLAKRAAAKKQRWMSVFFLRLPLCNPDSFLSKTMRFFDFTFTKPFLVFWILLQVVALGLIALHWNRFAEQFDGFFQMKNLVLLWGTMIGLKVFHELGHAYACKRFGGHVPEMGVFMIAFTPCAYVDATSAWAFTRRYQRLIVNFGGMYFELTLAAIAAIGFCASPPGAWSAFFHNIVFLASVLTVGFNVNPLMRFDGYYALSDSLEIPNLRSRSAQSIQNLMKRVFLGVGQKPDPSEPLRLRFILCAYGIGSALYRITVVLSIAMVIATKFFLVGIALGAVYIGMELVRTTVRLFAYLWFADETAAVRWRAVIASVVIIGTIVWGGGLTRWPNRVYAKGVVRAEEEASVRAAAAGFVEAVAVDEGQRILAGDVVVRLSDPLIDARIAEAQARVDQSRWLIRAYERSDRVKAAQERTALAQNQAQLQAILDDRDRLVVTSPQRGRVFDYVGTESIGRYVTRGEWIATVGDGHWTIEVLVDEDQLAVISPEVGDEIVFRASGASDNDVRGTVRAVEPVGVDKIDAVQLTQEAGGEIQVNPYTSETAQAFFRLKVEVSRHTAFSVRHGMTGTVQLHGEPAPLSTLVVRRVRMFLERLRSH
ncbi:MAG: HlyD family efflux transporter periplasmic adaptor subunit [Planctomycetota bacterium]